MAIINVYFLCSLLIWYCHGYISYLGGDNMMQLSKSHMLGTSSLLNCSNSFMVQFDIRPLGMVNDIGGIYRSSSTQSDCCDLGDRLPFVFFSWNSLSLGVSITTSLGNEELIASSPLPLIEWSSVKILISGRQLTLSVDGSISFSDILVIKGDMPVVDNRMLSHYASDSFHHAANAVIRNVRIERHTQAQPLIYSNMSPFETHKKRGVLGCYFQPTPTNENSQPSGKVLRNVYYDIHIVRLWGLNNGLNPFISLLVKGAPVNTPFLLHVKLKSHSERFNYNTGGFKTFIVPVVSKQTKKGAASNTTNVVELSGHLGQVDRIPADTDYRIRLEVMSMPNYDDPTTRPRTLVDIIPSHPRDNMVACARIENVVFDSNKYMVK